MIEPDESSTKIGPATGEPTVDRFIKGSTATLAVLAVAILLAVTGCGRRGSLEPPPDLKDRRDPNVPIVKTHEGRDVPDRSFFLDPLL